MISVLPNVSTAGNLRMTELRLAITCVPNARIIVTIAGNPSGIAATANEIEVRSISTKEVPLINVPTMNMMTAIAMIAMVKNLPKSFKLFFNGVSVSSA